MEKYLDEIRILLPKKKNAEWPLSNHSRVSAIQYTKTTQPTTATTTTTTKTTAIAGWYEATAEFQDEGTSKPTRWAVIILRRVCSWHW